MKKLLTFNIKDILYFFNILSKLNLKGEKKNLIFIINKLNFLLIIKRKKEIIKSKKIKKLNKEDNKKKKFIINYQIFFKILKTIKEKKISMFLVKKNLICLKKKNMYLYINTLNVKNVFVNKSKKYKKYITIKNSVLLEAIKSNIFINKKTINKKNGTIFHIKKDNFKIISSDNFRMSYFSSNKIINNKRIEKKFLIKKNIADILYLIIEKFKKDKEDKEDDKIVKIYIYKKNIKIDINGINIISEIFFENIFNYNLIFSLKYKAIIKIKKNKLLESLKRSKIINLNNIYQSILILKKKKIKITVNNYEKEKFIEEIENLNKRKKIIKKICVNTDYLIEPIKIIEDKFMCIKYNKKKNVILITSKNPKFKYFLMPIEL